MPDVKPFRALRYAPDAVPDLAAVVAPPYDVIDAEARRRLAARDPRNAVRIDLRVVVEYGLNLAEVASTLRNRVTEAEQGARNSRGQAIPSG